MSQPLTNRPYRRRRAAVLAASDVCWLCGHPGATTIDHVIPRSVAPERVADPANMRPAHGVDGCPTCQIKCNQSRGNKSRWSATQKKITNSHDDKITNSRDW